MQEQQNNSSEITNINVAVKQSFYNFTLEKLKDFLEANKMKGFVAKQLYKWVYKDHVTDFNAMTDISKSNQKILDSLFYFPKLTIKNKLIASNHATFKFLFELEDKNLIETVIMHHKYGYSACLTTQVGCNMGCSFCASGQLKKVRNLSISEIVLQLITCDEFLRKFNGNSITRIVIMGIGEPFDNYDNLLDAIRIINNPYGIGLGSRKITISSCGLMEKMINFAKEMPQVNLAISLHASNQNLRLQMMPIARRYKYEDVLNGIDELVRLTNRRVTLEYILIDNLNDSYENAVELANNFKNKLVYVNLIPYNPVLNNPFNYFRSTHAKQFQKQLTELGIQCTLRQEFGTDINAACGQLRAVNMNPKLRNK